MEGDDDKHVFLALLKKHGLPECFRVESYHGLGVLWKELRIYLAESEIRQVGLVIDADQNPEKRWNEVSRQLRKAGYEDVPELPQVGGMVIPGSDALPRIGVWLMPDNLSEGALEEFIASLIRGEDALWPYAQLCVDQLPEPPRFPAQYRMKATVRTWLSWQNDPGRPFGHAITRGYLDGNHEAALHLMQWIDRLFVQNTGETTLL